MRLTDRNRDVHNIVLLAIVCLVLQLALAPNIALLQGHANFACIFAMLIALSIGGRTGTICGFVAGILYDLSSTSPIGLMALLLTVCPWARSAQPLVRKFWIKCWENSDFGYCGISGATSFFVYFGTDYKSHGSAWVYCVSNHYPDGRVFSTVCVPLFSLSKLKHIFGKRT